MQLIALSNLLFVDAEFSEDRAKGGADKEAPLVVFFWKCEKKKRHKHLDIPLCHHGLFFSLFSLSDKRKTAYAKRNQVHVRV